MCKNKNNVKKTKTTHLMFNNKKQFKNFLYVEHNYKHTNIILKNKKFDKFSNLLFFLSLHNILQFDFENFNVKCDIDDVFNDFD